MENLSDDFVLTEHSVTCQHPCVYVHLLCVGLEESLAVLSLVVLQQCEAEAVLEASSQLILAHSLGLHHRPVCMVYHHVAVRTGWWQHTVLWTVNFVCGGFLTHRSCTVYQ